jgi:hypothetical protein
VLLIIFSPVYILLVMEIKYPPKVKCIRRRKTKMVNAFPELADNVDGLNTYLTNR